MYKIDKILNWVAFIGCLVASIGTIGIMFYNSILFAGLSIFGCILVLVYVLGSMLIDLFE